MEDKCRSCLTVSSKLQYYSLLTVFPEFARKSLSVLDLLSTVTSSQVDLSNDLPSKICSKCFKSLKFAYSFIVAFQHAQKILLEEIDQAEETELNDDDNQEQISDLNEEKIIIITEEENENANFVQIDNISSIEPIVNSEDIQIDSSQSEQNSSDAASVDHSIDGSVEDELDWFDDDDEDDNVQQMSPETEEAEQVIFDDDVDQEIIKMEKTIVQHATKPEVNKPDHAPPKPFQCEFCENKYTAHRNLLAHIRSKHPEDAEAYQMKLKDSKLKKELEIYKCESCSKVFYVKQHLTNHNYTFHHPEWNKIYRCDLCNEVFQSKNAARYHKLAKHEGKNFTCSLCPKKFITVSTLKQHITGVHEKNRPEKYLCSICGRGFTNKTALKYHTGKEHTNQRDFVCSYCGAAFILVGELRTHERNHTGERPFSCKFCKKSFKRSSEKQKHEATHLGIYPHKCEYCKVKEFTSKYNMKVHWLQHRGKFECEVCDRGFASAGILKFHYTYRHKITAEIKSDDM